MASIPSTEPDDSFSQANQASLGAALTGTIASSRDIDYFKFTLTADNVIRVDVSAANVSNWAWTIRAYDASGTTLAGTYLGYEDHGSFTFAAPAAGTYYLSVGASNTFSTQPYTLTATVAPGLASDYESEGNGTIATADALPLDRVFTGQRYMAQDVDYFRVDVGSAGNLVLDFRAPASYDGDSYSVGLYDAAGKLIESRSAGSSMTLVDHVAAGSYYVRIGGVDNGYYESGDYKLVAHVDSDAARTGGATLAAGKATAGNIASVAEKDWYKLDLVAGSLYEFCVAGNATQGGTLASPSLVLLTADGRSVLEAATNLPTYVSGETRFVADPTQAFIAPYSGTYYLLVDGLGNTGSYTVTAKPTTQSALLPGLLHATGSGYAHWAAAGGTTTVKYAFMQDATVAAADGEGGFRSMTASEMQAVRDVLALYSTAVRIDFVEVSDPSQARMLFGTSDQSGTSAGVCYTDWDGAGNLTSADVYLSNKASSGHTVTTATLYEGGFGYETLIHEIGHALGLKHPGDYNAGAAGGDPPYVPAAWDSTEYTVMSYIDQEGVGVGRTTPSVLDIAALQSLYGARTSSATSTLTLPSSGEFARDILAGAVTLDLSNQSRGATVSLTSGTHSSIGSKGDGTAAHDNVGIAVSATVNTLIGSAYDDYVVCNGNGDRITAGAGNDTIVSGAGADTIDGGSGSDAVLFAGQRWDFRIMRTSTGFSGAAKSGGGTDAITNVETFVFGDGSSLAVDYSDVIQDLYVAYFGRPADYFGFANFSAALAGYGAPHDIQGLGQAYSANAQVRALIDSFGTSTESKALYTGDTRAFVTAIYQNVLSRQPDSGGLDFWAGAIDNGGLTRSNAALSIMAGALANTTAQGLLDGALVNNKIAGASNFTFALDTSARILGYSGDAAAATARSLLATVTAATDLNAFESLIESTLDKRTTATGVAAAPESPDGHTDVPLVGIAHATPDGWLPAI